MLSVLAGSAAWAQGPVVTARTLMHMYGTNGPEGSALPTGNNVYPVVAARYTDGSVLVGLTDSRCYLADGGAVRQVMIAGTQIPGQAAGVVWGGRFQAGLWPIPGGATFAALASGPGIGGTPAYLSFVGDVESPASMNSANSRAIDSTTTGLTFSVTPNALVAVGPVLGPMETVIPRGYRPSGATSDATWTGGSSYLRLNNVGTVGMSLQAVTPNGLRTYAVVADTNSIAVRARSGDAFQSDRGPIQLSASAAVLVASQPFDDGSLFVQGTAVVAGANRSVLWRSPATGPSTVVFIAGDRAPGTEPGVTLQTFDSSYALAANRHGSLLLLARLAGPGVTDANSAAVYQWRRGTLTLIARSSLPSLYGPANAGGIAINSRDEIGIVSQSQARLYKPGVGTVIVANRGEPLNPSSGIVASGNIGLLSVFHGGVINTSTNAGNDDISLSCLSEDGRLLVYCQANTASFINFQITAPGCPSDFNLDGFTDFFDYLDFVTCFEGGRCPDGKPADFNDDGIADFFDYSEFVEAFEAGC